MIESLQKISMVDNEFEPDEVGRTSEGASHLRRYPAYKDSGVPWLGEIPAHWEVKRNKLFLREVNDCSENGEEELLTVSQYTGITRRRDRILDANSLLTNAASLIGYKHVQPGDLVMNIMLAWNGSLGISPIEGIVSPAYCVFRAAKTIEPQFLHYLLRTPLFTGVFKTVSTGIVDSRLRLYPDVFFRLPSVLPPPDEQRAIARFLEAIDRLTRRYINAQRRLIALLTEQKQALIQQAVTRGLNPDAPLKDSGIEWLGEIPAHWEAVSLGNVCSRIADGPHVSPNYVDDGVLFISARNVKTDSWAFEDAKYISWDDYELFSKKIQPEKGDVLYTKGGTTGVAKAVDFAQPFQVWVHIAVLKIRKEIIDPFYLAYALNSPRSYEQSQLYTRGATNQDLGLNRMTRIRFCLPPLVPCPD